MKSIIRACIVAALCCVPSSLWAQAEPQAVAGTVSGNVQQVGFRALILKQAIQHNLAGTAQNLDNGSVQFVLQGKKGRIGKALKALRRGTAKSSDVRISTSPAMADGNLNTFRVIGWTSTSRKITTPHDLVFSLRPDDSSVTEHESKKIYQGILKSALK
jgi:acylphosphatase